MFNELTAKQTVFHYILCDESLRFNKTALISQRHDYYCCATVPVAFHYTKRTTKCFKGGASLPFAGLLRV